MLLFYWFVSNNLHFKVWLSIWTQRVFVQGTSACKWSSRASLYQTKTLKCKWMYRGKCLCEDKWFLSRIVDDFSCLVSGILLCNCGMRNKWWDMLPWQLFCWNRSLFWSLELWNEDQGLSIYIFVTSNKVLLDVMAKSFFCFPVSASARMDEYTASLRDSYFDNFT